MCTLALYYQGDEIEGNVMYGKDEKWIKKKLVKKPEWKRTHARPRHRWEQIIKKWVLRVWTGFIWLRTGSSGGHL
jgi:hypothetical protein